MMLVSEAYCDGYYINKHGRVTQLFQVNVVIGTLQSLLTACTSPTSAALCVCVCVLYLWEGDLLTTPSLSEVWEIILNNVCCSITGKFIKKWALWGTCLHKTRREGQIIVNMYVNLKH